jgi:hypothetical protein
VRETETDGRLNERFSAVSLRAEKFGEKAALKKSNKKLKLK